MEVKNNEEICLEKSDVLNKEIMDSNKFNYEKLFKDGCKLGYLNLIKFLHEKNKINIHMNNDEGCCKSCSNGQLDVAKWLYGLDGKINIHVDNENAFCRSCYNGHLEVAKWLYGLDRKINIHVDNEKAFHLSCKNGFLEVIEYLISLENNRKNNSYMLEIHNAMMIGIENFYSDHIRRKIDSYNKIKKMLLLVKEFNEYQKNIDNIKFLVVTSNNFNYGYMFNIFEFMKSE